MNVVREMLVPTLLYGNESLMWNEHDKSRVRAAKIEFFSDVLVI